MREHAREMMKEMEAVRERLRGAKSACEREKHLALLDRTNRDRAVSDRAKYERMTETQRDRFNEYSRRFEAYERALERVRARAANAVDVQEIVQNRLMHREEDLNVLREYETDDSRLMKSLEFELSKVSDDVHRSQAAAADAESQRAALDCELRRVQNSLKASHARQIQLNDDYARVSTALSERRSLIKKSSRAKEDAAKKLEDARGTLRELSDALKRAEIANKSSQNKMTVKEQLLHRKNMKCQELKSDLSSSTQALETATHMCVSAARGVESAKARRHEAEMSLQSHINACKEKQRQVDKAKKLLADDLAHLQSSEHHLHELSEAHAKRESQLQEAQNSLEADKEQLFVVSKTFHDKKQSKCRTDVEYEGALKQSKHLREKESALQEKISKQREMIYTTSLRFQQLERKIVRLKGVRSDDENKKLKATIESLKIELIEREREHVSLIAETKENECKMQRTLIEMNDHCLKAEEAQHLRVIREAEADGSEASWRETRNTMELLQVELDELRLQIARRRRLLFLSTAEADEIVQRKDDIFRDLLDQHASLHDEHRSLIVRLAVLQQDAHTAVMDSAHRKQRLDHLRSRYDVLQSKSPYGKDIEIGEQIDHLAIIDKQRDELGREHDRLCKLIDEAKGDVEAMQNVLHDTERSNSELRAKVMNVSSDKEGSKNAWKETDALLEKLREQNGVLARLRDREEELKRAIDDLKTNLTVAVEEHNALSQEVDDAELEHQRAMRKYKSQKAKLRRARAAAASVLAAHRKSLGLTPEDPESAAEQRIRAHQLKESIHKAAEIVRDVRGATQALKTLPDSDGSSLVSSPTSSLASFFTFASSTTRSSGSATSLASSSNDSFERAAASSGPVT